MRVLVTGAAGFIGGHMVRALEADGHTVLQADPKLAHSFSYDELDTGRVVDTVVHLGAITDTQEQDTAKLILHNVDLPKRLWKWATQHQVPLFFASSAAVYGAGERGFHESTQVLHPLNPYGKSKLALDRWVAVQSTRGHQPPVWAGLRFFNVYGPGEEPKGRMASMVSQAMWAQDQGVPLRLFHRGEQMRDFVYVEDVVDVIRWMMAELGAKCSGLFNVGSGVGTSFLAMAEAVGLERVEWVPMPGSVRKVFQHYTRADLDRLTRAGYPKPMATLADGLVRYRRHLETA